jgi:hypothetical protein
MHRPLGIKPTTAGASQRLDFRPRCIGLWSYTDRLAEPTLFLRDEVLLAALDELASTVRALMVLLPAVDMTIFLVLGGLAPRTHISDDHRLLLTSTGLVSVFGQQ